MRDSAVEIHFSISQQQLYTEIYRKNAAPIRTPKPRRRLCASLRSRNALIFNISQVPLYTEIYRKEVPRSKTAVQTFVRACTVDMHFNISQEPLYTEIYRKKVKPRGRLCASLRSQNALKFNISQVPLYTEIYRKKRTPEIPE